MGAFLNKMKNIESAAMTGTTNDATTPPLADMMEGKVFHLSLLHLLLPTSPPAYSCFLITAHHHCDNFVVDVFF